LFVNLLVAMEDAVNNFCAITGATPAQASFFLESSGGDLEEAMSAFYDNEGGDAMAAEEEDPSQNAGVAAQPAAAEQVQPVGVRQGQGAWPGERHRCRHFSSKVVVVAPHDMVLN
jgi:hypothetical protein